MKKWLVICFLVGLSVGSKAQIHKFDSLAYWTWEDAQTVTDKSVVKAITFEKQKLEKFPEELFEFTHLRGLNLGKNKLKTLPENIVLFDQLEFLYLNKNKIEVLPYHIYHLNNLVGLDVSRNKLVALPVGISQLTELRYLDVWDTGISGLPSDLKELQSLEYLDVRGMTYSPKFLEDWYAALPKTKIRFDPPCNCKN
jgi:hypothetical protein